MPISMALLQEQRTSSLFLIREPPRDTFITSASLINIMQCMDTILLLMLNIILFLISYWLFDVYNRSGSRLFVKKECRTLEEGLDTTKMTANER